MSRPFFTSLRVQAILWTLLPLTVIMLIVGGVGVYAYNNVVTRLVQDRDRALARVSADRLSENMQQYAAVLNALATREEMRSEVFTRDQRLSSEQNRLLKTAIEGGLLASFDGSVTLFNRDGRAVVSVYGVQSVGASEQPITETAYRNVPPERLYDEEPFFQAPRRDLQPYFTDVIAQAGDPLLAEPQVLIAVPVLDEAGRFTGVLAGSFLLRNESLGREIDGLGVGTAYLVDRQGRVIWHPEPTRLGEDFTSQQAVRLLLNLDAAANAQTEINEQGEAVVTGFALLEAPGWGLVLEEPWDLIIGPVRAFQWLMLGALLVGLTLIVVIISSGTRRLTDPIQALVRQTQLLSSGDFVGQVQGGSIEEMRALSLAFNEMADRVARYRAGLQRYVAAVTHSQEEERKRIARELHDDTIQSLIALGRRLELMEQSLESPIDAAKQLYQLQQMLARTVAEVRQFSRDLRPLLLEDVGLEAALRQMLREMERRDNVQTELLIHGQLPPGDLDDELEVTLYRIAQEALNNIHKHAQATQVTVTLAFEASQVRLEVRDNGSGFPLAETTDLARRGSFGLMGIRERAKLFGGTLHIESAPGEGACIEVLLPLSVAPEWVLAELQKSYEEAPLR